MFYIIYNLLTYMNGKTLLLLCLIFVAFSHKDKSTQTNSIYQPFADTPKPQPKKQVVTKDKDVKDTYQIPEERRKQYQQFNQMLAYGLVIGTFLLACMLLKTCTNHGRRPVTGPATQINNFPIRAPILNKTPSSLEIKNRIEMLKKEVRRLEQQAKQVQQQEQRALAQRQRQMKRKQQVMNIYYNQMQMQETIQPKAYYNQPYGQTYQYIENIPVGRPIPKDNDSSFASQYPTI